MENLDKYFKGYLVPEDKALPLYLRLLPNGRAVQVSQHEITAYIPGKEIFDSAEPITQEEYEAQFEKTLTMLKNG